MTTTVDACIIAALETKLAEAEALRDRYAATLKQIAMSASLGRPYPERHAAAATDTKEAA